MLDLRHVSENLADVKAALARRGFADAELLDRLGALAQETTFPHHERTEALRQERNDASQAMAKVPDKKSEEFQAKREQLRTLGDQIKQGEAQQGEVEAELGTILLNLPNLPHPDTPDGLTEERQRRGACVGREALV